MGKTPQKKAAKREETKADRAAVKDLTPRNTAEVKAGAGYCANGQHIKDAQLVN